MQTFPRYYSVNTQRSLHYFLNRFSAIFRQILLDNDKRAYGVVYSRHGFPQIARAQKEIILSAGIFSSPLLLMKSGIGPESVLNAAEVYQSQITILNEKLLKPDFRFRFPLR